MSATIATQLRCARCSRYFADAEVRYVQAGQGTLRVCPLCGGPLAVESSREVQSLPVLLAGAFVYPFRGKTVLWVLGVIVASVVVSFMPVVGGILSASVQLGFLMAVLRSSADGKDTLEVDASELGDVWSWFAPFFRYLGAVLVSFGAAIVAAVLLEPSEIAIVYALALAGALYFPAAVIVAAHQHEGFLGALNPVTSFGLITRIPAAYAVTLGFLAGAGALGGAVNYATDLIEVPILGGIVHRVFGFFAPVVMMRMLGVLVNEKREEL